MNKITLSTEHLKRCIDTLRQSLKLLEQTSPDSLKYEIFHNAIVKGYELTLETAGKLLKRALKPYFANPQDVDQLVIKDIFRPFIDSNPPIFVDLMDWACLPESYRAEINKRHLVI